MPAVLQRMSSAKLRTEGGAAQNRCAAVCGGEVEIANSSTRIVLVTLVIMTTLG
jgi:hypothetical protein